MPDTSIVAAFDFDGTISTGDTFFPFLLYACGRRRVYPALASGLVELLLPGDGKSVRDRLKASLVRRLFRGMPCARLQEIAHAYAEQVVQRRLRPKALARIRWHREQGHRCIMVSASLDVYLAPIARALGFDDLLCTRLAAEGDAYSGELIGEKCRGAEKVARLTALLGDLSQYRLYA